jgi:hypothetical protein
VWLTFFLAVSLSNGPTRQDDWIGRVGKAIVRSSRTFAPGSSNNNANNPNNGQYDDGDDEDDIYENDDENNPYYND